MVGAGRKLELAKQGYRISIGAWFGELSQNREKATPFQRPLGIMFSGLAIESVSILVGGTAGAIGDVAAIGVVGGALLCIYGAIKQFDAVAQAKQTQHQQWPLPGSPEANKTLRSLGKL